MLHRVVNLPTTAALSLLILGWQVRSGQAAAAVQRGQAQTGLVGAVVFSSVMGSVFSVLLLWVIRSMDKWNDFNWLMYYLTLCQLLYDGLMWYSVYLEGIPFLAVQVVCIFGSVTSFLLSTVISYITVHAFLNRQSLQPLKWSEYKLRLLAVTVVINLIWMIPFFMTESNAVALPISIYLRLILVFMNCVFHFLATYMVNKLTSNRVQTDMDKSMISTVSKFKYFPIIQIVGRVGVLIYILIFPKNNFLKPVQKDEFDYMMQHESLKYGLLLITYLTVCLVPIGFFILYLNINPKARLIVKNAFCCNENIIEEVDSSKLGNNSNNSTSNTSSSASSIASVKNPMQKQQAPVAEVAVRESLTDD
jgi:hypothetical protein